MLATGILLAMLATDSPAAFHRKSIDRDSRREHHG